MKETEKIVKAKRILSEPEKSVKVLFSRLLKVLAGVMIVTIVFVGIVKNFWFFLPIGVFFSILLTAYLSEIYLDYINNEILFVSSFVGIISFEILSFVGSIFNIYSLVIFIISLVILLFSNLSLFKKASELDTHYHELKE